MRREQGRRWTWFTASVLGVVVGGSLVGCGAPPDTVSDGGADADAAPVADAAGRPRGLLLNTPAAQSGYVVFAPLISDTTYLVETVGGAVVHTWDSEYAPSGFVYLLDNGHLLRGGREPDVAVFSGGGQGGRIQEFTWEGDLVWDYQFASEAHLLHHDVEVLPNGNILAIAWEAKSREEARQVGLRPEMTPEVGIWPDMIVELEPQPPDGARVVWEWHAWDHLIQDRDASLGHHGDPSAHPELIDINGGRQPPDEMAEEALARYREVGYVPADSEHDPSSDMMHTNGIAYNAALDQIAVSIHAYNEIWILDHSTTTDEATGHTGGRWGRGGDLLYRWGNPGAYGRGGEGEQRLFGQHDVRWIPENLPGAGHLLVFSNNVPGPEAPHSEVFEIAPPTDDAGRYVLPGSEPFGPTTTTWSYAAPDQPSFHSPFISGAHRLPDGHTLITSGAQGRFFEVTPEGEIVWEYWSPTSGDVRMPDGSLPHPVEQFPYAVFRATKVLPDDPAVQNRELVPLVPQPPIVAPPQVPDSVTGNTAGVDDTDDPVR